MEDESDISSKRTAKSSSSGRGSKKTKPKKTKKVKAESEGKTKGSNELSLSVKNAKNMEKCLSYLESYYNNLNTSDLDNVITEKNLKNFEKLGEIENIQVDLLLTKIYHKIITSESLYTSFFSDYEEDESKIETALGFLDEVLKNVENFDNDLISCENFELKENILKLIKFMKINLKEALEKDEIKQLDSYINDLPNHFYSKNYLELMKYKTKVSKNNNELLKNVEKIDELLSNLESYYEQLSAIQNLFGDLEQDKKNYVSVSKKDIKKKKKKKKSNKKHDSDEEEEEEDEDDLEDETDMTDIKEEKEKITEEDIINYGQFLVNICVCHKYELKNEKKEVVTKKKPKKSSQKQKQKSKPKQKEKPSKTKNKSKKKSTEEEEEEEEAEEEEDENENEEENEDDNEAEEGEEEEEESEDDPETVSKVFLIDVAQKSTGKKKKKSKETVKFSDLVDNKICVSLMQRKNIFEIIKKNVENFNNLTKKSKNKEIKTIKEKLESYITSMQEGKNTTINSNNINQIKYFNNFSNNKTIIKNRDSKVFYIENPENQKGFLLIEFFLTDEKKDIIFTLSRYDLKSDDFNQIYTTDKSNKKCKLCIYFDEKSLYQLEFNNEYSWLNSKEINYNISLFKLMDQNEAQILADTEKKEVENKNNENENNNINKEEKLDEEEQEENNNKKNKKTKKPKKNDIKEIKEEEEEEEINTREIKVSPDLINDEKEIKFCVKNDNIPYDFNCNKIYKKIKDCQEQEKNNQNKKSSNEISLLIYQNKIRFVKIDENNKITYSEYSDEKDNIITKKFFNKIVYNYLKENIKPQNEEENKDNNNKVLINLYCQNQNLSLISPKIRDLISTLQNYSINNDDKFQNKIYIQFLEKLGFYPNKKISNYEIKYNLYDFTDQCLIYHLYLNHIQERRLDESTLVMIFDKENIHITALNKGAIFHKFKAFEKNWNAKYYSLIKYDDMESINNFIQAMSGSTGGLDLVLCSINNEEKKEEFENKFKQIKEFIEENVEERIRLFVYYEDMFIVDILKYIETFSDE